MKNQLLQSTVFTYTDYLSGNKKVTHYPAITGIDKKSIPSQFNVPGAIFRFDAYGFGQMNLPPEETREKAKIKADEFLSNYLS